MKLLVFSDLHCEFDEPFETPDINSGDVLVLAGDIDNFTVKHHLEKIIQSWSKPILFVAGNHEFYTRTPMHEEIKKMKDWSKQYNHFHFLDDEEIVIDDIYFFGGTMWTEFSSGDPQQKANVHMYLNDYRYIYIDANTPISPDDTIMFHNEFKAKLLSWLKKTEGNKRVVITHHCPVKVKYKVDYNLILTDGFESHDMMKIIENNDIDAWIYGHNHQCDNRVIHDTKVVSNQRGYRKHFVFECEPDYQEKGLIIDI